MACLLTLWAAGTFSIHSAPGPAGLIGLTGFSWAPASGTGASAAWPGGPPARKLWARR